MLKETIIIKYSKEDEGYIAITPKFKNISGFGITYQKALKELLIVLKECFEIIECGKKDSR